MNSAIRPVVSVCAAVLLIGGIGIASAEVIIDNAWSRATPPGHPAGGAYFEITNNGERGNQLIGVTTDPAPRVELHQTIEDQGNARMVHTPVVRIPAGETISFEPGGRHVMLMGLTEALVEGEIYQITLELERGDPIQIDVEVRSPTYIGESGHESHKGNSH